MFQTKGMMMAALVAAALLTACSPDAEKTASTALADDQTSASADTPAQDDGLSTAGDTYVSSFKGKYELWENLGDDGRMCEIQLTDVRTIGGYRIDAAPECLKQITVQDITDLSAWFVAPDDGHLVMIDATRKPLMRLKPGNEPRYFDNSDFYAVREN